MKKIIILASVLILSACDHQPEASSYAGVGIQVDTLFTKGNCTMYRFMDGGRNRYYADCSGTTGAVTASGTTSYSEACGNNCDTDGGVTVSTRHQN